MKRFILSLKRFDKWYIVVGIFLLCLLLFFSIRASDEDRWSDWGFGDAQTMLSLRHWDEGGWIYNKFLFVPQGYAKVVYMFDEHEVSQHGHGICPGVSHRVGPKLRYTHYPAGYLIPYAFLFRLGLEDIFYARMLSLLLSFGAVILMYIVFSKITGPGIAFFSVVFYVLSPPFFGFSDSIANQPIDDFLRFAFMLAIVYSTRTDSLQQRRLWMISAWIFEFLLSLSSFDSVFFVYLWLIGWDILERRGFRWKTYLIYAMAPITAHSLQFLQNVWYLGFDDTITDINDTFLQKTRGDRIPGGEPHGPLMMRWVSIQILFSNLYRPAILIAVMFITYILYARFLKDKNDKELPSLLLLIVLLFCGLIYLAVLPHGARMPYEARQMIPFTALLVGGITWSFLKEFKYAVHRNPAHLIDEESALRKRLILPYLLLSAIMLLLLWYIFIFLDRSPVYKMPKEPVNITFTEDAGTLHRSMWTNNLFSDVILAKGINEHLFTTYEPVIFSVWGFQTFWDPTYVAGYPQVNPIIEYYTGSKPILCFDEPGLLASDLIYLLRRSPYKFSPVLVTRDDAYIENVLSILQKEGVLRLWPSTYHSVMGRYLLDLTDYLNWEASEVNQ